MIHVTYFIDIHTSAAVVYERMLRKNFYEIWTQDFNPTSTYIGTWKQGEKILFVSIDEHGKKQGLISRVQENNPHKFVSLAFQGLVHDDQEITEGPSVEAWKNALENYTFQETNGTTLLTIDMDIAEEFKTQFDTMWNNALLKLKSLCENP